MMDYTTPSLDEGKDGRRVWGDSRAEIDSRQSIHSRSIFERVVLEKVYCTTEDEVCN